MKASPWMTLALAELGVAEIPGAQANARIVEYQKATPIGAAGNDEIAWCADFVNFVLQEAGFPGTGSPAARSFLQWGSFLDAPTYGAIVVLSRGSNPAQGHVGFLIDRTPTRLWLLGGNQGNRVSVAPFEASRIIGRRWPPGVAFPLEAP